MRFTYIFDPLQPIWLVAGSPGPPNGMADGRWYPTLVKLGSPSHARRILAFSGYRYDYRIVHGVRLLNFNEWVEIYDPTTGWTRLPDEANMPENVFYHRDPVPELNWGVLYPGTHIIPYDNGLIKAGEIFFSMPQLQAYRFNPDGLGSPSLWWNSVGNQRTISRGHGCSVMLPIKPGTQGASDIRVVILGGTESEDALPTTKVQVINLGELPSDSLDWRYLADLYVPRKNANAVLLPDGKLLIVGGNQLKLRETAVTVPELYDPDANNGSGSSTILPAMTYQRMYHSTAILLPDASVLVSGGEKLCDGIGYGNNNFEIYKPGYLFEGDLPVISNIVPRDLTYGQQFAITLSASDPTLTIDSVVLMRPGVPTHAFDQDQRAIKLKFTQALNVINATAPANGNIAPPGYYMLFVLRPKSESSSGQAMIPSKAKFVKLAY